MTLAVVEVEVVDAEPALQDPRRREQVPRVDRRRASIVTDARPVHSFGVPSALVWSGAVTSRRTSWATDGGRPGSAFGISARREHGHVVELRRVGERVARDRHRHDALAARALDGEQHLLAERRPGAARAAFHDGELLGVAPDLPAGDERDLVVGEDERLVEVGLALEARADHDVGLVVGAERRERHPAAPGDADRASRRRARGPAAAAPRRRRGRPRRR